jgi:hypothetical protein
MRHRVLESHVTFRPLPRARLPRVWLRRADRGGVASLPTVGPPWPWRLQGTTRAAGRRPPGAGREVAPGTSTPWLPGRQAGIWRQCCLAPVDRGVCRWPYRTIRTEHDGAGKILDRRPPYSVAGDPRSFEALFDDALLTKFTERFVPYFPINWLSGIAPGGGYAALPLEAVHGIGKLIFYCGLSVFKVICRYVWHGERLLRPRQAAPGAPRRSAASPLRTPGGRLRTPDGRLRTPGGRLRTPGGHANRASHTRRSRKPGRTGRESGHHVCEGDPRPPRGADPRAPAPARTPADRT